MQMKSIHVQLEGSGWKTVYEENLFDNQSISHLDHVWSDYVVELFDGE
jgi:hypothetical protein